jgi:hypothetical protein
MWAIANETPYSAERTWIRDKTGSHQWIVAVKATFVRGSDGALRLADEQLPSLLAPEYFGEPGKSGLRYESDLGPMKATTDVVVVGSAYAPGGRAAAQVAVSLRADEVHKQLVVHGERRYRLGPGGLNVSGAAAFVTQPLRYELAFGGTDISDRDPRRHGLDKRNPIGRGFAARWENLIDQPAPCIEYPGGDPAKTGPAGFGAIASYWSPRLELWGTYDAGWERSKKPLLPDDFDERASLCAPADQRPERHLRGGEPFELQNMTADGVWRFPLPRHYLTFTTHFGRRTEEHRARLVTVVIEPDEARIQMTFQTSLAVRADQIDYLDKTVIGEKAYLS